MASPLDPVGHASELVQQGRLPEAREALRRLLEGAPDHPEALHLAGLVEVLAGAPAAGIPLLRRAVELAPKVPFAWSNLGAAYNASGDFTNALACFQRTLELAPGTVAAMKNQGIALRHLGRHEEAMASLRRAAQREPNDFELHREAGDLLVDMGRPAEALARYDRALVVNPADAATHHHRGFAALRAGDPVRAERDLRRALELAPRDPFAHNDLGIVLEGAGRREDAVAAYTRAVELREGYVEALENRAAALAELQRFAEALADYERVEALAPGRRHNAGHRLQAKLNLCDWKGFGDLVGAIGAGLEAGRPEAQPFSVTYVDLPWRARRACAELYAREALSGIPPVSRAPPRGNRLRVGYFSADMREHPVGQLLGPLAEAHDRTRFEATAFSYGPVTADPVRARLQAAFEHFEEVAAMRADAIAALARERNLDIAIDLMGHTSGARTRIFAHRAAPVQAQYLGFPGTMGTACIDYLIADRVVVPVDHRQRYTERLALLPATYQVNDADRARALPPTPSRAALGLPEDALVFCCFNNKAKITPDAFDLWMRVLRRVEGSVLWLVQGDADSTRNLRAEAAARGIAPERLVFAARVPIAQHLARARAADIALDTIHYNGHATTSDTLLAGVPVVACLGNDFQGRVAASLLHAVGMPELVAESPAGCEALAVRLASDAAALAAARDKLARNRDTQPLFDATRFARHLEALYERMAERSRAGLPPDHIEL